MIIAIVLIVALFLVVRYIYRGRNVSSILSLLWSTVFIFVSRKTSLLRATFSVRCVVAASHELVPWTGAQSTWHLIGLSAAGLSFGWRSSALSSFCYSSFTNCSSDRWIGSLFLSTLPGTQNLAIHAHIIWRRRFDSSLFSLADCVLFIIAGAYFVAGKTFC